MTADLGDSRTPRRKPKYVYEVVEKLRGEATYWVCATSQQEATELVRNARGGPMIDHGVDHVGPRTASRMEKVDPDTPIGEWMDG